jgi:hypothetical protein
MLEICEKDSENKVLVQSQEESTPIEQRDNEVLVRLRDTKI